MSLSRMEAVCDRMSCSGHWLSPVNRWLYLDMERQIPYDITYTWNLNYDTREGGGTPLQSSCLENPMDGGAWWAAIHGVAKSQTRLSDFTLTFHFHALENEMATHSSVLAWRIPGTGEPGGLPSMGSNRVGHDWSDLAAAANYDTNQLTYETKAESQPGQTWTTDSWLTSRMGLGRHPPGV